MSENGAITWTNERRRLRDLVPWEHNPREINRAEAERLGESLLEFGQIQTIAVGPDNEVYDGHQRKLVWSVLPQFGPDYEVDVRVSSRPLTERERQKLVVFLHRGAVGQWDWDELANSFELPDLLEWGFDEGELIGDWGEEPTPDPGAQIDKAQELQEKWGVVRGDIWVIESVATPGKFHRVMCGDSTSAEDVGRLMGGERAGMVFTDPPYNVAYGSSKNPIWGSKWNGVEGGAVRGDDNTPEEWTVMCRQIAQTVDSLVDGFVYVCHAPGPDGRVMAMALDEIMHWSATIIWKKDRLIPGRGKYQKIYEPMWFGWNSETGKRFTDSRTLTDVWEVKRASVNEEHPTMKPTELVCMALEHSTRAGDVAADLFLGSGTTLVACEQTGRIGYGMEIEPKYVSVTLERLAGMGLEPQRVTR